MINLNVPAPMKYRINEEKLELELYFVNFQFLVGLVAISTLSGVIIENG